MPLCVNPVGNYYYKSLIVPLLLVYFHLSIFGFLARYQIFATLDLCLLFLGTYLILLVAFYAGIVVTQLHCFRVSYGHSKAILCSQHSFVRSSQIGRCDMIGATRDLCSCLLNVLPFADFADTASCYDHFEIFLLASVMMEISGVAEPRVAGMLAHGPCVAHCFRTVLELIVRTYFSVYFLIVNRFCETHGLFALDLN